VSANALFLLVGTVGTFFGFADNSFEERQAATCPFQKTFAKVREMYQPIGKGIKIHKRIMYALPDFKSVCKFKRIWCSAVKHL
jgi:hypothetical protein